MRSSGDSYGATTIDSTIPVSRRATSTSSADRRRRRRSLSRRTRARTCERRLCRCCRRGCRRRRHGRRVSRSRLVLIASGALGRPPSHRDNPHARLIAACAHAHAIAAPQRRQRRRRVDDVADRRDAARTLVISRDWCIFMSELFFDVVACSHCSTSLLRCSSRAG